MFDEILGCILMFDKKTKVFVSNQQNKAPEAKPPAGRRACLVPKILVNHTNRTPLLSCNILTGHPY